MTFIQPIFELQHCNNRNSVCRVLRLCRAPAVVDEVNTATASAPHVDREDKSTAPIQGTAYDPMIPDDGTIHARKVLVKK